LPDFGIGMDQWRCLGFRSTVNKYIPYCHIANFRVLAFHELEETKEIAIDVLTFAYAL